MFLRRSKDTRDPLAVVMSGVRLGERVLQVGVDDARLIGQIAAKAGLSGSAACLVTSEAEAGRARKGADDIGVLVETTVGRLEALPQPDSSVDVVVVHSTSGLLARLGPEARQAFFRECLRVLRVGGRTVCVESGPRTGVSALMRSAPPAQADYDQGGGSVQAMGQAGLSPVRLLGEREGYRFSEGLKTQPGAS